ncbi:MAG: hypothetical protein IJ168_01425 [Eubacterium sp.]|nr:hypothetical protein [Eubacterium sp.]
MANFPQHEIEAFSRLLLPQIQAFFDSEKGQKEFEEWKKKQEKRKNQENPD